MSEHKINRFTAIGVFLIAAIVYLKTLSVTVVFWDVGEFIASAVLLQVPHPPGSPLFILLGRICSQIPYFTDVAARVHAISATMRRRRGPGPESSPMRSPQKRNRRSGTNTSPARG